MQSIITRHTTILLHSALPYIFVGAVFAVTAAATNAYAGAEQTQKQSAATEETTLHIARAARAAGDYSSAINLYRDVVSKPDHDPAILLELADTYLDAGSFDDAIQAYTQLKTDAATRVPALVGLVRAELTLGANEKALAYADEAKSYAPNDPRVLVARGVALDSSGRHKDAQDCYRAVLVSSPFDIAARNDLALSLAFDKKFAEAIDIMTPMARSSNATPKARQNLALVYGLEGDRAQAEALSQMDLDQKTAQANLRFFDFVRAEN